MRKENNFGILDQHVKLTSGVEILRSYARGEEW